ncbi:S-layer homology domain-containing protein [Tepidibacter sp. Z1-5]|uniref:S-layer homology domain-containing protein n=1 Tax=Tepidibacter sp. Z1-5 TaxID=3134138 RepID=UPI0030C0A27C
MKNTKKVLSVALAGALAFGSMGSAFAAGTITEGIDNKDMVKAVERLSAFGIVNGMEDGKYHAEMELTRAQFSKMLVEALGLKEAAVAAQGIRPDFNDVDASCQWAWGYINVASGQNLIKGMGAKNFAPNDKVTYAQALTMLVRSLGYKDEFLKGTWPGNYIAKANDEDITDDVKLNSGAVNRGDAAVLLDNTLDAQIIKASSFSEDYFDTNDNAIRYEKGKTLLEEKLQIDKYKEAYITAVPRVSSGLGKNEIEIKYEADTNKEVTKRLDVKADLDLGNYIGENLTVYVNDDDEVFYVEKEEKQFKVYYDIVGGATEKDGINLVKADDDYDFAKDAKIYLDNDSRSEKQFIEDMKSENQVFAKVVLDKDGKVAVVDAYTDNKVKAGVVTKVDTDKEVLSFFEESEATDSVNLKDDPDKYYVYNNSGEKMELKDIKANDVVYITEATNQTTKDKEWYVYVVRETVEGEFNDYKVAGDDEKVKIGDKEYKLGYVKTISLNNNGDIDRVDDDLLADASDSSEKVLAIFDAAGKIRHITTAAKVNSGLYGIVTRVDDGLANRVKLFNNEGKEVVYDVDMTESEFTTAFGSTNQNNKAFMIEYGVNKDGELEDVVVLGNIDKTTKAITYTSDAQMNDMSGADVYDAIGRSSLAKDKNNKVTVDDKVVAFNLSDYVNTLDSDDIEVLTWEKVLDQEETTELDYIYRHEDGDTNKRVDAVFFTKGLDPVGDDIIAGYVIDNYKKGSDDYIKVALFDGEVKTYKLDLKSSSDKNLLEDEKVALFKLDSDGEVKEALTSGKDSDYTYEVKSNLKVTSKDGSYITVAGKEYKVNSKAVIYKEDDKKGLFDVKKNEYINIALRDNEVVAIEILGDNASDVTDGEIKDAKTIEVVANDGSYIIIDAVKYPVPTSMKTAIAQLKVNDKIAFKSTAADKEIYQVTGLELNKDVTASVTGYDFNDLTVYGNVLVNAEDTTNTHKTVVEDLNVEGNLTVSSEVTKDFGMDDVKVTGTTIINGGDDQTVVLNSCNLKNVEVNKREVGVVLQGGTTAKEVVVNTNAKIDAGSTTVKVIVKASGASVTGTNVTVEKDGAKLVKPELTGAELAVSEKTYIVRVEADKAIEINDATGHGNVVVTGNTVDEVKVANNGLNIEFANPKSMADIAVTVEAKTVNTEGAKSLTNDVKTYKFTYNETSKKWEIKK